MINCLRIGDFVFAPNGKFEPCGMFTLPHIIAAVVCFLIVICGILVFNRKRTFCKIENLCKNIAPILTVLELIKISHSFIYKNLNLDSWFPLSFCGLFIFALWMSGYGKSVVKSAGDIFIAYGCPVGGIAFLIFPTTSLMSYPIWHYFSLYSLLYHSAMIFFGVLFLIREGRLTSKKYFTFGGFILIFALISIAMNCIWGCNIMNLREPYNIPIPLMQNMYSLFPPLYTVFVLSGYLLIPAVIGTVCGKLRK